MALLWDSSVERFVGCISNTDFIHAFITFERALALPLDTPSPSSTCSDLLKSPELGRTSSSASAKRRNKVDDRVAHSKIIDAYLKDRTIEEWMSEYCSMLLFNIRNVLFHQSKSYYCRGARRCWPQASTVLCQCQGQVIVVAHCYLLKMT